MSNQRTIIRSKFTRTWLLEAFGSVAVALLVLLAVGACVESDDPSVEDFAEVEQAYTVKKYYLKNKDNSCLNASSANDATSVGSCSGNYSKWWLYNSPNPENAMFCNVGKGKCLVGFVGLGQRPYVANYNQSNGYQWWSGWAGDYLWPAREYEIDWDGGHWPPGYPPPCYGFPPCDYQTYIRNQANTACLAKNGTLTACDFEAGGQIWSLYVTN